jgi:hypothetical protein
MSELLKPPAVPVAILNFFASQPDFPAVAGDISEEFHQRIQSSGPKAAKRWYWCEVFRNALALTWREMRRTPVRTTSIAFGCYVAVNLVSVELTLAFNMSWMVILALRFTALLAMGWIGAKLLPGREWALALTFAVMAVCLTLPAVWYSFTFVFKHTPSLPFWAAVVGFRPSIFWLGCLLVRYINNRKHSSIVSAAKSA